MDCGFGLRETERRLSRLGLQPAQLDGIVVTHEHGDHVSGVARLARRYDIPVWATHGTLRAQVALPVGGRLVEIHPDVPFAIGDLQLTPYAVPHDALEPVQYVFSNGAHRLGVLTDAGHITPHIEATLQGLDALVLECNHDVDLLARGRYPLSLKRRVGGSYGHLSNAQAADLLDRIGQGRLQHLVAAHLSRENNTAELAVAALAAVLGCGQEWVGVASQEAGLDWRLIS